ncbi:MAG: DUF4129 domain-containing protein, partial [Pseudanabaenaceae cyanobacterium]
IPKPPAATPQEYAASVATQLPSPLAALVWRITAIYQDWHYGNRAPTSLRELQTLLQQLQKSTWRKISYTRSKV